LNISIPKSLEFNYQPKQNKAESYENTLYTDFYNDKIIQYKYNQNEKTYQYSNKNIIGHYIILTFFSPIFTTKSYFINFIKIN